MGRDHATAGGDMPHCKHNGTDPKGAHVKHRSGGRVGGIPLRGPQGARGAGKGPHGEALQGAGAKVLTGGGGVGGLDEVHAVAGPAVGIVAAIGRKRRQPHC